MTVAEPRTRYWTREEYYRLAEEGWFAQQRVQLIHGEIIQMPPQGHQHALAVMGSHQVMEEVFGPGFWVREEKPLNLGLDSDPEPDVAVIRGSKRDYSDHPTTAVLVIEVSDTTLRLDRRKAGLYAASAIPEYWIVNIPERQLEVYRSPVGDAKAEMGHRYSEQTIVAIDGNVSPVTQPKAVVSVRSLFG